MKCPACHSEFDLTLKMYMKAPTGKFPCPLCQVKLAGKHRWYYWLAAVMYCVIIAVFVGLAYMLPHVKMVADALTGYGLVLNVTGRFLSILPGIIAGGVVVVFIDLYMERYHSILGIDANDSKPSEDNEIQPGTNDTWSV